MSEQEITALVRKHQPAIERVCARGKRAWLIADAAWQDIAADRFGHEGELPAVLPDDGWMSEAALGFMEVKADFLRKPSRLNQRAFVVVAGEVLAVSLRKNTLQPVAAPGTHDWSYV